MSNNSTTASQVIALPKGGGALSGIGETFSPDLHSGTGNFAVPISLPPGRNGVQPQLRLAYSTGAGNGPFGLGWGISVPSVTRKTAKGVSRYRDNGPDLSQRDTETPAEYHAPGPNESGRPRIFFPHTLALPNLLAGIRDGSAQRRVISQTPAYYDGDAFTGLPLGQVGPFGVQTCGETLALTDELVRAAYQGDADAPSIPPYLDPFGPAVWSDGYPQAFREAMPPLAGYNYRADADHLLPTQITDAAGLITQASYDYRVLQPRQVIDPNGNRTVYSYRYDLLNHPLRIENGDAGTRRVVLDALGNEVERRDSKGAPALRGYDLLARLTHSWARDEAADTVTPCTRLIYGDSAEVALGPQQAQAANLLGKLYQQYDEAGRLTIEAYDFKGNALEKQRQVIGDGAILSVFPKVGDRAPDWRISAFQIDWQPAQGSTLDELADKLLDPTKYQTSTGYDALNRVTALRYPQDVEGKRKELRACYDRGGELAWVELKGADGPLSLHSAPPVD